MVVVSTFRKLHLNDRRRSVYWNNRRCLAGRRVLKLGANPDVHRASELHIDSLYVQEPQSHGEALKEISPGLRTEPIHRGIGDLCLEPQVGIRPLRSSGAELDKGDPVSCLSE